MPFDYLNELFLHLHAFKSKIHTLVQSNLLHANKSCQYHHAGLLTSIMHLFSWSRTTNYQYSNFSLCFLLFSFVISSNLNIFEMHNNNNSSKKSQISSRCIKLFKKKLPFFNTYIENPKIKPLKTLIFFLNFIFMKN